MPVHIHCSETEEEVTNCVDAHGVSPVGLLDRLAYSARAPCSHMACGWTTTTSR